ncbi:uncharacterized protein N7479_010306 [Penicillium vulpinum]|uniref:Uncharacterized protein n=1 Tax=Penicillium vulpinum TaxID=29845 RepID=A0A1V6S838_9EURO|nr:uncharacterized protein N7479_010306 [Penicillium vulpinum]KAJ5951893.1 hypothetical protein N7479_010306 [Penicillium vulpinum]OQE10222.1 hypothetical protein PENVUL_c004G06104 [Penicillium vulpinum]
MSSSNRYPDTKEVDKMDYEKRFLIACACFKSCLWEEFRFLGLADGIRIDVLPVLHKLVKLLEAIFFLGEEMAKSCPDCLTVRNRPQDHFLAQFEHMCRERIMSPLAKAICDLEADEMSAEPKTSVDFIVASDLDDIRPSTILLSSKPLPLSMGFYVPLKNLSRP